MFPVDLTLEETKRVVLAHNEALGVDAFVVAERGEFTIFNYLVSFDGTFPEFTGDPVRDREIGILRECRGLTFWTETGEIAARKFHKFFNVSQRAETQPHVIDWSQPHIIMEKLDGSMITPVGMGEKRQWHTKMGATDVAKPVEEFVAANPVYAPFADWCIFNGYTPLFEWCSRQQRIVIDYPEDNLVLLAIRTNRTGEYFRRDHLRATAEVFSVPVVTTLPATVEAIEHFLEYTYGLKGAEGFVVQFENGLMVKVKAEEYCLQHSAKEGLEQEKNVWSLILSDVIDDQMALMIPQDRERVTAFVEAFENAIAVTARNTSTAFDIVAAGATGEDDRERKKNFALTLTAMEADRVFAHPFEKSLMFALYNGNDAAAEIRRLLANHTSSASKVDAARCLVGGLRWDDFKYMDLNNEA